MVLISVSIFGRLESFVLPLCRQFGNGVEPTKRTTPSGLPKLLIMGHTAHGSIATKTYFSYAELETIENLYVVRDEAEIQALVTFLQNGGFNHFDCYGFTEGLTVEAATVRLFEALNVYGINIK